jgi:hypothetical protein
MNGSTTKVFASWKPVMTRGTDNLIVNCTGKMRIPTSPGASRSLNPEGDTNAQTVEPLPSEGQGPTL